MEAGKQRPRSVAERWWLVVPLAMATPLLLNDSMFLVLGGGFARDYFTYDMASTTIPIVINSLMGLVAVWSSAD